MKKEIWVLLEIHHDSDKGSLDVDFDHVITLYSSKNEAIKAKDIARQRVMHLPIADTNAIVVDDGNMVVFASDDFWKWEIYKVQLPEREHI